MSYEIPLKRDIPEVFRREMHRLLEMHRSLPPPCLLMNGKKAAIDDIDMCMECGACMMNCAFGGYIGRCRGGVRLRNYKWDVDRARAVLRLRWK